MTAAHHEIFRASATGSLCCLSGQDGPTVEDLYESGLMGASAQCFLLAAPSPPQAEASPPARSFQDMCSRHHILGATVAQLANNVRPLPGVMQVISFPDQSISA